MIRSETFEEENVDESQEANNTDVGERPDSFSLEFAASQWQRLVSNAEGLFVSLCKQGIPKEAREQIDQWFFLKQECEDCFTNDGSIVKEKETFSLSRIDEVTESESNSSLGKSDSDTEYSDSGAEIDDAIDLSQVETKRHDFVLRLEILMDKFRDKTEVKINKCIGPIEPAALPKENPPMLISSFNILKNQRRKSILPSTLIDYDKLPINNSKKEFDLQSSLTQSKKKIKKFLRQLRKEDEQNITFENEEPKKSKDKLKKADKNLVSPIFKEENTPQDKHDQEQENQVCTYNEFNKPKEIKMPKVCTDLARRSDEKILRDEITNLRITRDFLLEQRKSLDAKLNRERAYSVSEQRRFIELDEAVDAIDTTIEFKNGSICGRKSFEEREREEGEQMLLDRLMQLNEAEMRSLLFKYFQKTVDLREWGRNLEQEIAQLDHKIEAQAWKIQALTGALQQANAENERRLVMVHREHEEKLHLMFRHYTGTGTGTSSSADTRADEPRALPSLFPSASIPHQNLRKLQASSSAHITKVTRQKNKLIIQQQQKH